MTKQCLKAPDLLCAVSFSSSLEQLFQDRSIGLAFCQLPIACAIACKLRPWANFANTLFFPPYSFLFLMFTMSKLVLVCITTKNKRHIVPAASVCSSLLLYSSFLKHCPNIHLNNIILDPLPFVPSPTYLLLELVPAPAFFVLL